MTFIYPKLIPSVIILRNSLKMPSLVLIMLVCLFVTYPANFYQNYWRTFTSEGSEPLHDFSPLQILRVAHIVLILKGFKYSPFILIFSVERFIEEVLIDDINSFDDNVMKFAALIFILDPKEGWTFSLLSCCTLKN